jgi:hypothetical protein
LNKDVVLVVLCLSLLLVPHLGNVLCDVSLNAITNSICTVMTCPSLVQLCGHLKLGQFLAVELLMTPDSPQDFLSEAQLMSNYSFLTDLSSGLRIDHPNWSPVPSPLASTDDFGSSQFAAEAAAAAMAAMAVDAGGAEGAASAAAAAAALQDGRRMSFDG